MDKTIIIGGGMIGLSLAYELACRGRKSMIIEQGRFGTKASWAGAGMLPPENADAAIHPQEHLAALSNQLHQRWSEQLLELTGIDNGFRATGSLFLARTPGEIASLFGAIDEWTTQQIDWQDIPADHLSTRYPFIGSVDRSHQAKAVLVPSAAQFDNRQHLLALLTACRRLRDKSGPLVELHENVEIVDWKLASERSQTRRVEAFSAFGFQGNLGVTSVPIPSGSDLVLAAGAWTESLAESLGRELPMQPVRGQMVGYQVDAAQFQPLLNGPYLNEGTRYVVTRQDGRIIAGSTIEETGFDESTTPEEIGPLRQWTETMLPCLNESNFVDAWAGLRPATYDGFPYLGKLTGYDHVWVATGHFKAGLQLSTGSAFVLADLIEGKSPTIDLAPFDPGRVDTREPNAGIW